ncbi:MAG: type IX secretion system sortase PorU [Bacteroidota bacterium]
MRSHISLLLLIFIPAIVFAQKNELKVSLTGHTLKTIHLSKDISARIFDFENAQQDDAFGMLPLYIYRIPVQSDNHVVSACILDEEVSTFSDPGIGELADIDKIGSDFIIISSTLHIDGRPYGEIMILPLRNASGDRLEVLNSFTLEYEINEVAAHAQAPAKEFVDNSVLATGKWYRFSTDETGIYRITYEELAEMGIALSSLDPRNIRIFGNGNGIVPEKNSDERIDDLEENPIYIHGEEDGSFDQGDYILFYGQSSTKWNYVPFSGYSIFLHENNPYTDLTYYFLNIGDIQGKRITSESNSGLTPTVYVNEFTDYAVHENDTVNILKTGREWYGEKYGEFTSYDYTFEFPNIVDDYQLSLSTNIAAHSTIQSNFDYYCNDQHLIKAPISKIVLGTTVYAWTTTPDTVGFYSNADEVTIRVDYDKPTSTSIGWMNYISLNARRKLIFTEPCMSFRDHLSFGPGVIAGYELSGADEDIIIWDVTDPFAIIRKVGSFSGGIFNFIAPAEEIREFIAFDGSGYKSVEFVEEVKNQNLHSYEPAEYIILAHPDFMTQAQRMLSLHQTIDEMNGLIVTPQQVYNEFSSGKLDPSGIRDFIRMLYEKADLSAKPRYLLLLGDASYDYKDRLPDNTNFVPAYQSVESLKLGYSFVTDDFYALLDDGEGVNAYGKSLEIGIGRFPVHTVEQAEQMVDKVETYLTMKPDVLRNWRNSVAFIADDEDQNLHFTQAEKLEYMIDTGYRQYNCPKIYLDAFPQLSSPSGHMYPEVNKAIYKLVQDGCFIVNYTGHGGETGWAHEGVLDIQTINQWTNWNRLPLFITATCEFSRYDDPSLISAGEYVFLNPRGGGIGLLTTSRLAWADPNFRLNKAVYKYMFRRPEGKFYKIGDVVRLAKTHQNNGTNIKNFVLLGDPAMQLAYPEYWVETISVNDIAVSSHIHDTLNAMSEVVIHGMITDCDGDTVTDFNGILYPLIFDKEISLSTLGNDNGSMPHEFNVPGQKLAESKVSIENGLFTFTLFMPQNMITKVGFGKLSYYAYDTINLRDAHGYSFVKVGGVNNDYTPDNEGPDLSLYMNNTDFVTGGFTDSEPVFLAYLFDEHGISFTGNGIGRDITLILDDDPESAVVLNSVFDPDMDNYHSGWLSYPLSGLEDGLHTLTLKAWDNMNNVSEKTIQFEVNVNGPVKLTRVYNYPNPFHDVTYFVFDHNKAGSNFDIELRIFNVNGQHVRTIRHFSAAEGLSISPIEWDGRDEGGRKLGNGIYIYRMYVTDKQGTQFVQTSKLIFAGE